MTIGTSQSLTRSIESPKLGFLWDSFIQSRKCAKLKVTEELHLMKMKNDVKFEG